MTRAMISLALVATLLGCNKEKPATPTTTSSPPSMGRPAAPPTPAEPAKPPPSSDTGAMATADAGTAGTDAAAPSAPGAAGKWMEAAQAGKELYANFQTSMGSFTVKLFAKEAPKTVANFVGLATGEKEWRDPKSGQQVKGKPLYSGTIFHRVIPNFMVQGGDPLGTGTGDPGYRFEDEFGSGKTFDKVGLLAMANAGPGTNGSQFFVTVAQTPWLNNRHTIFGEITKGYDVIERIAKVPTRPGDRPVAPIVIEKIEISDKP